MNHGLGRLIDLVALVQLTGESAEQFVGIDRGARGLWHRNGRDVEEAVEVDADGRVEYAPQKFGRLAAPKALLDGVGKRERVQGRVPVAEFVARRESGDAEGGRVHDRARQLHWRAAVAQGAEQCGDDSLRVVAQKVLA